MVWHAAAGVTTRFGTSKRRPRGCAAAAGASSNKVRTYASWNLWFNCDIETRPARRPARRQRLPEREVPARRRETARECIAGAALRDGGPEVELHVDMNWADRRINHIGNWRLQPLLDRRPDPARLRRAAPDQRSLQTPSAPQTYEPSQFRSALTVAIDVAMIIWKGGITHGSRRPAWCSPGTPITKPCTEVSAHLVANDGLTCSTSWAIPLFGSAAGRRPLLLSEAPDRRGARPMAVNKYELS
jgi:hypothetical protein